MSDGIDLTTMWAMRINRGEQTTTSDAFSITSTLGTTFPPSQKPAAPEFAGSDIDVLNATADDIHAYIDEVVGGKSTVTKEILGKDASGKYDVARYIFANREHLAWVRENYPKLYAWKNGATVMYTESVSPRVGDRAYTTPYVSSDTTTETVTVPAQAALVEGYRWSASGKSFSAFATVSTFIVPVSGKSVPFTISLQNASLSADYTAIYGGNPTPTDGTSYGTRVESAEETVTELTVTKEVDCVWFFISRSQTSGEYDDTKLIVDGTEMDFVISSTTGYTNDIKQESTTTTEVTGGAEVEEVKWATVADGATTNETPSRRVINGLEYVRYEAGDVEPTVVYTDADDERNGEASITEDGVTYHRYPLGDLGSNRTKLIPVFIYANEHGIDKNPTGTHEPKMCALVAARFLRDLCAGKQASNPLYKFIRDNCMVIVIPVANPFGYNYNLTEDLVPGWESWNTGYLTADNLNINRNYDTPGWVFPKNAGDYVGSYPGSGNETQYIMNTMVESGAVVAMSLHGLGGAFGGTQGTTGYGHCAQQGQNPDGSHYDQAKMDKINELLREHYGYELVYYESMTVEPPAAASINTPDVASKAPSYITQCGAYGGIVEFQPDDPRVSGFKQEMKGKVIENAYAQTINLLAMWLSEYLERSSRSEGAM